MAPRGDGGEIRIRINFDIDDAGLAAARAKIEALAQSADGLGDRLDDLSGSFDKSSKESKGLSDALDGVDARTRRLSTSNDKLADRLNRTQRSTRRMSMAMKGLLVGIAYITLEWWAMVAALASVNALLVSGQAIMKAYQWVMKGVAYGVGATTVLLGVAASAQREYNASMQAFRYKSVPALGSGTAQAMAALRGLTSDSELAVFGMQALTSTFAAVSQNAELTGGVKNALRGLGDFAISAGGDIGQNLTALGGFLGLLVKTGSVTDEVAESAGRVSSEFGLAIENAKKMGITTSDQLMAMFSSGEFAKIMGVDGALGSVNETLFGQLKSYFTQIQTEFADFGQFFLDDAKKALDELVSGFRVAFTRITGVVAQEFGDGKLFDDIVNTLNRFMDFSANVVEKYLPQSGNLWSWLKTTITSTLAFFDKLGKSMRGLSEASKVMTDSFGPVLRTIGRGFKDAFSSLGDYAKENRDEFMAFGDSLSNFFAALRNGIEAVKTAWLAVLPYLTSALNILAIAINAVAVPLTTIMSFFKGAGADGGAMGGPGGGPGGGGGSSWGMLGGVADIFGGATGLIGLGLLASGKSGYDNYRGKPQERRGFISRLGGRVNKGVGGFVGGVRQSGGIRNAFANRGLPASPFGQTNPFARMSATGPLAIGGQLAMLGLAPQDGRAAPFQTAGGLASFFNPMLGLGISGVGTAVTSDNAVKGALSGAMGGAAIGTMIAPGVGTAIGAGVGTLTGGTAGAVRQFGIGAAGTNDAFWKDVIAGTPIGSAFAQWGDMERRNEVIAGVQERNLLRAREVMEVAMTEGVEAAQRRVNEIGRDVRKFTRLEKEFSGKSQEERTRMAEELLASGQITREMSENLSQRYMGTFGDELRETQGALEEASRVGLTEMTRKLEGLTTISGKSENEIKALADTMGVNLMDGTQTMVEALEELGLATLKTAEQIKASVREVYASQFERLFMEPIKKAEAQNVMNDIAEGLRQIGPEAVSQLDLDQAFYDMSQSALVAFGGNASDAAAWMLRTFGPGGTAYSQEGGPVQGFGEVSLDQQSRIEEAALLTLGTQAKEEVTNVLTALATGSGITASQDNANAMIETLTALRVQAENSPLAAQQLERLELTLLDIAMKGGVTDDDGKVLTGEEAANAIESALGNVLSPGGTFLGVDFAALATKDEEANAAITALSDTGRQIISEFDAKISEVISSNPNWWSQDPSWYSNPPPGLFSAIQGAIASMRPPTVRVNVTKDATTTESENAKPGDTTSSRLAATMRKHSAYDSMLAGSRYVTSSWRNWGLGSQNSDHITGNAYDLQGQNLVGYSALVNRMGGFAEFHGTGADRHLHVVPGSTAIGDSMAPVAAPVISVGTTAGGTYNINIYPQPGQDPNAIANAVIARIDQRDRDRMERS